MYLDVRGFTFCLMIVAAMFIALNHHEPALANDTGKTKAVNKIKDPSFENGSSKWKGSSTFWDSVICDSDCDNDGMQNHARTGEWWAWFGGNEGGENATKLSQNVRFPSGGAGTLSFYLYLEHNSGNGQDQLSVYIDNERVFKVKDGDPDYDDGYTLVEIDVGDYCDGNKHRIRFRSTSGGTPSYVLFAVDDVSLVKD